MLGTITNSVNIIKDKNENKAMTIATFLRPTVHFIELFLSSRFTSK